MFKANTFNGIFYEVQLTLRLVVQTIAQLSDNTFSVFKSAETLRGVIYNSLNFYIRDEYDG